MSSSAALVADAGSFRDGVNKVYHVGDRVLRGLNEEAGLQHRELSRQKFFQDLIRTGAVVATRELDPAEDEAASLVKAEGWSVVLEHDPVPFISYPYEWCFSMLQDAALLQLEILERCLENGWSVKDASPYNVQWQGARPTFIDIGSFESWTEGEPWVGYRQFCSLFLIPLMLRAHLGIDHLPLLRSRLEGIGPREAARYFRGVRRLKAGVPSHVLLPAMVENSIARRERDAVEARQRRGGKHSKSMLLGLVQGLRRVVRRLSWKVEHTDWSQYARTHSYEDADFQAKKAFVERHLAARHRNSVWDIGCNTGAFSQLAAQHADFVLSLDGDHDSIEQLYRAERGKAETRILPLVMDLANISPNQGWAGQERKSLDSRRKPDLVLCLALIHHIRVSASVPIPLFLDWIRKLDCDVVLEFVDREDEMFRKLLVNRTTDYPDYSLAAFEKEVDLRFRVEDRQPLKDGRRQMFFLIPR